MDTFLQLFQFLFQPNDFTKPIIILLILIGLFLFGLFTYTIKRRKLKVVEEQLNFQLAKQLKNSQDLAEVLLVLALMENIRKK